MNKYEALYILQANLDESAKEALVERFSTLVTANGGEVESVNKWGNRRLAYPIHYKTEGYYVLMTFSANSNLPLEIERQMGITDEVMRSLIVKK